MIYTIGYAGLILERFLQIFQDNNIKYLIDVRSLPKSKYFYQFNDNLLSRSLAKVNIQYKNLTKEFGARQDDINFYTDNILDYSKFAKSEQFASGMDYVKNLVKNNNNIC